MGNPVEFLDPAGEDKYQKLPDENHPNGQQNGQQNGQPAQGQGDPVDVKVRVGTDLHDSVLEGLNDDKYGPCLGDTNAQAVIDELAKQANGHPVKLLVLSAHGEPPAPGTNKNRPGDCPDTGRAIFLHNNGDNLGASSPLDKLNTLTDNGVKQFAAALKQKISFAPGAKVRLNACYSGFRDFAQQLANALGVPVEAPDGECGIGYKQSGNYITFNPQVPTTQQAGH